MHIISFLPVRRAIAGAAALVGLVGLVAMHTAGAQAAASAYHVTQRITLGGEGGWDYVAVDTAHKRLFIARSDRIMVVDEASGKLLGEIAGLNRGHGVAFD